MGLFFNYDRPGPGIDKNAPKKQGVFLFFELLGRNLRKLTLANMLYFAVSLPVLVIYYMIISLFLGGVIPDAVGSMEFVILAVILTVLIGILWGTGPASSGYTYILRNAVREEHTFLTSDFFEKAKEGFWHGLLFLIVDIVMLVVFFISVLTYWRLSAKFGGMYTILLFLSGILVALYTIMHFYLYEMEVTFQDGVIKLYKNSFLMSFATMPMCFVIAILIITITYAVLSIFTPIAVVLVAFFIWISLMRFMVDFYTARVIKKNILSRYEQTDE